jgi:hypothetical protein
MWIAPLVEPKAVALRERCQAWAAQHEQELRRARPDLVGLINRAAEVWWPLLAIGELAGGTWETRARMGASVLAPGGGDTDGISDQVRLLTDIREAFGAGQAIFTKDLLPKLNALDESPWGGRRKGEGLDARALARMLRPFKVRPRSVRVEDETSKGYHLSSSRMPSRGTSQIRHKGHIRHNAAPMRSGM